MNASLTALIEESYRRIEQEKMQDVPILNPALKVEAIGFDSFYLGTLGILITPWFINLLYVPNEAMNKHTGEEFTLVLPSGEYAFIAAHDEAFGEFGACSLFSPVLEFADHDTAVLTAEAALKALYEEASSEIENDHDSGARATPQTAGRLTRRQLLRGEVGSA